MADSKITVLEEEMAAAKTKSRAVLDADLF
jgi:hypothetical protein